MGPTEARDGETCWFTGQARGGAGDGTGSLVGCTSGQRRGNSRTETPAHKKLGLRPHDVDIVQSGP